MGKYGRGKKLPKSSEVDTGDWELFARCASGFEMVLAQELKDMGLRRVRPLQGGVCFFGDLRDAYVACLWSRVATRIQLVLARVDARDADELYLGASRFAWERHIPANATIAVEAHGTNEGLRNTRFTALKVKDALCDRMRTSCGRRPDVNTESPDFDVNVALHKQKATLYLNLAGESLHRRGYRKDGEQSDAPLKETLAAGMLMAAGWPSMAANGATFVDPMCGSGTLAIEAALMASQTAPGLLRKRWGFEGWLLHDSQIWQEVLEEARLARRHIDGSPRILAGDLNKDAIQLTLENAGRALVRQWMQVFVDDARELGRRLRGPLRSSSGLLATNPPYGIRLLSPTLLQQPYSSLATAVEALPKGWTVAILTPDASIDSHLGRLPSATLACYNGSIPVCVRLYSTSTPRLAHQVTSLSGSQCNVAIAEANSAQFASRLRKVAKERARWAKKEGLTCYRIYDTDLPEYAFSLDLYHTHVLISEHRQPRSTDPQRASRRLADAAALSSAILGIEANNVLVRAWHDASDHSRRKSEDQGPRQVKVYEGVACYDVNLLGEPDEFHLGQRLLRRHISGISEGASVAALFAPSASLMMSAAYGGAKNALLVDASQAQLDRASRLMGNASGMGAPRLIRADPRQWVRRETKARRQYDLVLCAPPEWRRARDAGGTQWDMAKDHVSLLLEASKTLSADGILVFVCPYEGVTLQPDRLRAAGLHVESIGSRMVPHDFERSRTKTRIYELSKRA